MTMFYQSFYSDLPDQFVDAHSSQLIMWAENFAYGPKQCRVWQQMLSTVNVRVKTVWEAYFLGPEIPLFDTDTPTNLGVWMKNNGDKYNGRYWTTFTPNQRGAHRTAGQSGGGATITNPGAGYAVPSYITWASPNPSLAASTYQMLSWTTKAAIQQQYQRSPSIAELLHKENPPLKREIKLGEITGYRCWRIENGLLRSVYQKDVWQPDQILEGRGLEDWGHRGIHAWKHPESLQFLTYLMEYLASTNVTVNGRMTMVGGGVMATNTAMVTGSVLLWGDVVEHDHGWRGEFAKIKSLDWLYPSTSMMGKEKTVLDVLRKSYNV